MSGSDRRAFAINTIIFALVGFLAAPLILLPFRKWIPLDMHVLDLRYVFPLKLVQVVTLVLAGWIVARRSGHTVGDFGLPWRAGVLGKFSEGAVWGFAMLSAVIGVLIATAHFHIDSVALTGGEAWKYALGWGVFFVFLGIFEEFFFRGYFLWMIARRMGFWSAAVLMAISFGIAHMGNSGENALGIAQVVVFALFASLALRRTGNLWFPIGVHGAWDWAQTYFYGTPDSGLLGVGHFLNSSASGPAWLAGGSSGPEGSIIATIVLLVAAGVVHLRFPNAVYPDYPR